MLRSIFKLISIVFILIIIFLIGVGIYTLFFDPKASTEAVNQELELSD